MSSNVETGAHPPLEEELGVPTEAAPPAPDAARSAAGRLGALRVHELARLGREYEREHGLTPGRQRRRQLIQLGKRYEQEHGLRIYKPRRKSKGNVWQEFLKALARIVKSSHRPEVEKWIEAFASAPREPAVGDQRDEQTTPVLLSAES